MKYLNGVVIMSIGETITQARTRKGLKQEDAAKAVGVTVQTYSKWENDKTEPKASQAAKLANVLDITIEAVCTGVSDKKMELVDFVRLSSKASQYVDDFTKQLLMWERLQDDYEYIDALKQQSDVPIDE